MGLENISKINTGSIIDKFAIEGKVGKVEPFGNGHINDTFQIVNSVEGCPDYLLQRVNHEVFKDVPGMMNNIWQVTEHINKKNDSTHNGSEKQETLKLVKTNTGEFYSKKEDGSFWRVFDFKKGLKSYDLVETPEQAYEGAKAFGLFFKLLSDFPAEKLTDTIPNFHNIILRLETLKDVIKKYPKGRSLEVQEEIKFVFSIAEQMCQIETLKNDGVIPLRVTHNDTKFNNVLLSPDYKGICVIDLDTVMPGVVHYDFGDGIRTGTTTAEEDEADLNLVQFDINKYEAFAAGYLEKTREILSPVEVENLGISGALFAYIMGVRFLTDYISHDVYYKIGYPSQNINRARCQFELTRKILERLPELNQIAQQKYGFTV
ncbi:MAG: thiamine kinase-like enzyme [Cyclobacteriaceae bacterium]|jgi:thiamine kinase-like enzyme